jgi:hypothetical protein
LIEKTEGKGAILKKQLTLGRALAFILPTLLVTSILTTQLCYRFMYLPAVRESQRQLAQLTAQYEETLSSAYYQDSHDCYAGTTESGERFVARFHTESRQLTFFKYSSYEERELSKPILTESECRAIAEKFLFEDMNVSGEYETKVTYQEIPEFANGVYICRFQRVVDQIETDEYAEAHVAERGRVILYRAHMLGAMDGIRPAYQEEEIRSSIEHKLADIYASVMAEYTCTYEITDMRLTRLYEDGQLYLACSVNVYVYRSGGEFDYTESPYLFVSLA